MNKWIKVSTVAGVALVTGALYLGGVSWAQGSEKVAAPVTNAVPTENQHPGRRWGQEALFSREEKVAMLAEALGMKVEELQQARASGQRLRQIVQAQGLTRASFRTALSNVLDQHLQQAVTVGRITQAQADRLHTRLTEQRGPWRWLRLWRQQR